MIKKTLEAKLYTPQIQAPVLSGSVKPNRVTRVTELPCAVPSFEFRPEYPIKIASGQAHTVTIKDQIFKPENLKVTQGDSVEFCLLADSVSENDFSLYYEKSRSHVISFEEVGFESPLVRISNRGTADKTKTTFVIHFY
jgi:plastocyanin